MLLAKFQQLFRRNVSSPLRAEASRWPKLKSLQAVVLLIIGSMMLLMQFAIHATEAINQREAIVSLSEKRAAAAIEMIGTFHTQAMLNRTLMTDRDAAIESFTAALAQLSSPRDGIRVWVTMGPEVTEFARKAGTVEALPRDDVDRQAVSLGREVRRLDGNVMRVSRPVVLGVAPADNAACLTCHSVTMGLVNGAVLGTYNVAVDLAPDYAAWTQQMWEMVELASFTTLAVLALMVSLLRRIVVSPLEKLSALTRRLTAGDDVEIEPVAENVREIADLADALHVFRDNQREKQQLEAERSVTLGKLSTATASLDLALRSIMQGLCLFSADRRLTMLNERFLEIYGLDEATIRAHRSFESLSALLNERSGEGSFAVPGPMPTPWDAAALPDSAEPSTYEHAFGGRVMAVTHAITDEGGWVTTVEDVTLRRQHEARIAYLARYDSLTGLPNRVQFHDRLRLELDFVASHGMKVATIGIDLNKFKEINDQRGHVTGDLVLSEIGRRITAALGEGEFAARIGGDEFAAAKRFSSDGELNEFLSRLDGCFASPIHNGDDEIAASASLGVAIFPADGNTADLLINNADLAMYRAKRSVLQNICFYEASMDEAARERRSMAHDLWDALARGEFHLTYQVQKLVMTEETTGYEALLRWTHPTRGLVSPEVFIPIAEECGAIIPIGKWVLRQACIDARMWRPPYRVAVNLSPVQIAHDDIVPLVREVLIETGLPPSRLELEITESTIIGDKLRALHVLRQLKALGVSVALDDFGTGYSSLDTLNSFPFDKIKIDRSFLMAADRKPESRAIVKAVLALGRSLSVPVLAEGVETRSQLQLLAEEGCAEAQGFYFGRPSRAIDDEADELVTTVTQDELRGTG